jgi:DNA polymerase-1
MKTIAFDTETTGTDAHHGCRPFMILACDGETNYYWEGKVNPYTREVYWDEDDLLEVYDLLMSADRLVFHGTMFDLRMFESIGIPIDKLWDKVEDTMLMAHAVASGDRHGLKPVAKKYLRYPDDDESDLEDAVKLARRTHAKTYDIARAGHRHLPGQRDTFWKCDYWLCPDEVRRYGFGDVERTLGLYEAMYPYLVGQNLIEPYRTRKKLLKICYDIKSAGLNFYADKARKYLDSVETKLSLIRKYIEREMSINYKFNWNKPAHLIRLLHDHLKIPPAFFTPSGRPSANKEAVAYYIENHKHKILRAIQIALSKETESRFVLAYFKWLATDGRIHSNVNPTGTRETRQSSSEPNQQNIKGALKKLFGPLPGTVWYEADFKNIELRIWAYAVGNEELIQAFESGASVHMMIMKELYPREYAKFLAEPEDERLKGIYRDVKSGNFALIYGATEAKADKTYGYTGATNRVFSRFPGISEYTQSLIESCEQNRADYGAHAVITLGGYRLDVPPDEPFKACNYYVQGSAGWIMTLAMIAVVNNEDYIESGAQIVQQVHDSLVIEIPDTKAVPSICKSLTHSMENCAIDIFGPTPVDWKIRKPE